MPRSYVPWCRRASAAGFALLLLVALPKAAQAQTITPPRIRSPAEANVGIVFAGTYAAATTMWAASMFGDVRLEYKLVPALALGAAGAWALAAYDQQHPFAHGTLANTASGATVGLAIAAAWVLHNHAGNAPWSDRTSNTLLWASATVGAGIGALTAQAGTTPGRAAFTSAASLWFATATGLAIAGIGDRNTAKRSALLGAAVSLEAGVIAAGWLGRRLHPTVSRVAWASAAGLAAGAAAGGSAWALSGQPDLGDTRATWIAASLGLLSGGILGYRWP